MSEESTSEESTLAETVPAYATAEQALAWKSPEPLTLDYAHSDTGQTYHIVGLCKAKDRKAIYEERRRLLPLADSLASAAGYVPTDADITDACWCAECVAAPKMTALQWLIFGAEASLGELSGQCLIASRVIEDRAEDATEAKVPDGVEAAKQEMEADPLVSGGGLIASAT